MIMMYSIYPLKAFIFFCLILLFIFDPIKAIAETLNITIKDEQQKEVEYAVAYAIPTDKKQLKKLKAQYAKNPKTITIDQRDKTFKPALSVLQMGTTIHFMNHDPVKHHVYSFSQAKSFEIPLYSGKPPKEIILESPGVVVLGCNIHDWMLAHILVTETPFFAISDHRGHIVLNDLPAGEYRLSLWHPQQKEKTTLDTIIQQPSKQQNLSFQITLKANWRNFHQPRPESMEYDDEDDFL